MAEPQRASSLPDSVKRSRHARPPFPSAAPRWLDETQDLSPPVSVADAAEPLQPPEATVWSTWARRSGRIWRFVFPPRSRGDWGLMAVLLLGLALSASALLADSALSRLDRLLGAAVFLAGLVLLLLVEIGRRNDTSSR